MQPRVLISDKLAEAALNRFRDLGVDATYEPSLGKDTEALARILPEFDGLAVRSATKVTEELLDIAPRLSVVGRAGIGVDNIDIAAATRRGVIVMNTPFGNSVTTAEHAIAMMMAVARKIPVANSSTHAGKWEKPRFMGVELSGKTLGVIGCGNIGSAVCIRACGLKMKVLGYDPFLSAERATELGIRKVTLETLLEQSDFITLHLPLTERTRNILDAKALARTRKSVRIINCARGGLVDEKALADAIRSGQVAGAAVDVFVNEPPVGSPLIGMPEVVVTPHLGASTAEAQENVALQVADQMAEYLLQGSVSNALNMPSISAEDHQRMAPWLELAEHLGSFVGQMTDEPIRSIDILYDGSISTMNTDVLDAYLAAGLLRPAVAEVSMVSALAQARERGIVVSKTTQSKSEILDSYVRLKVVTDTRVRSIAGTVFSDGKPRLIEIKGIRVDAEIYRHMLYSAHGDVPGMIGMIGTTLGNWKVNIANFTLGRTGPGEDAIALLALDERVSQPIVEELKSKGHFRHVRPLFFDTGKRSPGL